MPFTFAHPAAVLPFPRQSRYVHFPALVFGSMAPDFEYFLNGQPVGSIGHTWTGFVFLNLPLVIIFYFIYRYFVHQTLLRHLPIQLQIADPSKAGSSLLVRTVVFCLSALAGMLTHVVWDAFTHEKGYMVLQFPGLFASRYTFLTWHVPVYKLLQHGSTLAGLTLILGYLYRNARPRSQPDVKTTSPKQKRLFWLSLLGLTVVSAVLWQFIAPVPMSSYGTIIVRVIDSFLLSVLTASTGWKYVKFGQL